MPFQIPDGDWSRTGEREGRLTVSASRFLRPHLRLWARSARSEEATQPNLTKEQLNGIRIPVWIVDGDHEEAIKRENTEFMAAQIPRRPAPASQVSHFAFLQDPE